MLAPLLRDLRSDRRTTHRDSTDPGTSAAPRGLHAVTASLVLATALGTARRSGFRGDDTATGSPLDDALPAASRWAPLLVAPVAAAAHFVHAIHPESTSRAALRVLDSAVVGAGLAVWAGQILRARHPASAPEVSESAAAAALGLTGLLGLLIEYHEATGAEAVPAEPQQREALFKRLLPRRKPRSHRIVIHV
jgi:hypothetical protein